VWLFVAIVAWMFTGIIMVWRLYVIWVVKKIL
jgi:hypothetical protein